MNHQIYTKRDNVNSKTMNESFNLLKGVSSENETGAKEKNQRKKIDETRVLKDKTEKHTNLTKNQMETQKEIDRKDAAKEEFSKLSDKDKVLRVRHKLEKIIHKKERNQQKAMDLLRILERIKITEELLSITKIDLTLEALRFIVKDDQIVRKTEKVLKMVKQSVKQPMPIDITSKDWRKVEEFKDIEIVGEEIVDLEKLPKVDKVHWMDQFIENDKKLGEKLDSLNKKLEAMSSDVKEIAPSSESSSNSSLDKLSNPTIIPKNSDKKTNAEEKVVKIQRKLKKAMNGNETDEVYSQLKKLSDLTLTKEVIQNTEIKHTIRDLEKISPEKKVLKYVHKILDMIKECEHIDDDLDDIAATISQMSIRGEAHTEKTNASSKNMNEKKKASIIFDEIEIMSENINQLTLKEKTKVSQEIPKLFSEPSKITKHNKDDIKEKELGKELISADCDSLTNRLKRLEVENKLHKFKNQLDELDPKSEDNEMILNTLKEIQTIELSVELLENTKIGISLNKFRKTLSDETAAKLAKDIVRKWKQLVPAKAKAELNSRENEDIDPEEEEKERQRKENEDKEKTLKVRQHCQSLLYAALSANDSIPISCQIDAKKLADAIEEAIFDHYKETNQKYRSQVHSRQYNIKKNLTLQENLVLGNITVDEIAVMTHEDMANDDLKKMREDLKKKGFDCIPPSHVADDMFCTCRICLPPWIHK